MFPEYYQLHDGHWITRKLSYAPSIQYRNWIQLEQRRWPRDGDHGSEWFQMFNPLLHHIDDNIWAKLGKLKLVKPSVEHGVESVNLGYALDNLNPDVEQVIYRPGVDPEDDSEIAIIHYPNSIIFTI